MNFISSKEKVDSVNFVTERGLMNDVWVILEGPNNEGVSARNFLSLLLAIMGLNFDLPKTTFPLSLPTNNDLEF